MKQKIKFSLKIIGALFITLLLIAMAGIWRLSVSPLKFDKNSFIMSYIPQNLSFETISLKAPNFYTLPQLEIIGAHYRTPELDISSTRLEATCRLKDLLVLDFGITSVTLENPQIWIKTPDTTQDKTFLETLRDSLSDIPLKHLTLQRGDVVVETPEKRWHLEKADLDISQTRKEARINCRGTLEGLKEKLSFETNVFFDKKHLSIEGTSKVHPLKLNILPFEDPTLLEYINFFNFPLSAEAQFKYVEPRKKLDFSANILFHLKDKPAVPLSFKGKLKGETPETYTLEIKAKSLNVSDIPFLWPSQVTPPVRSWIVENVHQGNIENLEVDVNLSKNKAGETNLSSLKGSLKARDATVVFLKEVPPLTEFAGTVNFDHQKVIIKAEKAMLSTLTLDNSRVTLSEFEQKDLKGNLDLKIKGPLKSLSDLFHKEPFKKILPFEIDVTQGDIEGGIKITLPLKSDLVKEEVTFQGEFDLQKSNLLLSPKGQPITLKQGDINLKLSSEILDLAGKGNINGLNSTFTLKENFKPDAPEKSFQKFEGTGNIKGLLELLPGAVKSHLKSPKGGEIQVTYSATETKEGVVQTSVELDYKNAMLQVPAFNWTKPIGVPGTAKASFTRKNNLITDLHHLDIKSKGLEIQGKMEFDNKGQPNKLIINPFKFNTVKGTLSAQFVTNVWKINVRLPYLNVEPFTSMMGADQETIKPDKASEKNPSRPSFDLDLKITLATLHNGILLKNVDTFIKSRKDTLETLTFKAEEVNGPLTFSYQPKGDKIEVEASIPKLEALLRGLNLSDKTGASDVKLTAQRPLATPNAPFKGKLSATQIQMKEAPVFVKLLGLISIEGLVHGLKGEGLVFTHNRAFFDYKDKMLALRSARMMNNSIGVTASGYINLKEKTLDLQGALIPANIISQFVGKIPLLGNFLTGGKNNGLFSVSFSLKGPFANPQVSSNPLGIIAPNFIKSLFADVTGTRPPKPSLS